MTSKEALKQLCKNCEYHLSLSKKLCPFRSISNEYCDEYNGLLKKLELLEKLKEMIIDEIKKCNQRMYEVVCGYAKRRIELYTKYSGVVTGLFIALQIIDPSYKEYDKIQKFYDELSFNVINSEEDKNE